MSSRLIPPGAHAQTIESSAGPLRVLHAPAARVPVTAAPNADAGDAAADAPATDPSDQTLSIVPLHGGGSDNAAISWYRLFEPLARYGDIWAPDLPGFGGSIDCDPVGGPAEQADLVAEVISSLQATPAVVVGVSMGGDVALNLALRHPDLVQALVLIAPGGLVPVFRNRPLNLAAWAMAQLPDAVLFPLGRLANRFVDQALRSIVEDPARLPSQVVAEFVREARHPRAGRGYARYNQATLGPTSMRNDLTDRVRQIGVPTLFFHGRQDPMVDPAGSQRAAERMSHARLVLVDDCGHWAQLEHHDRFVTEVEEFLRQLR